MATSSESFHWVDYVIFALMLALSCGVGIYYAFTDSKKQNQDEYLLGNRKLKWLPVSLSIIVSLNSSISQLGKPAEVYLYGIQCLMGMFGLCLAIIISTYTFLPLLFKLKITSTSEYLELRYQSKVIRKVGTVFIIASDLIYIGIAAFSPAIALETVTGFPVWFSLICIGAVSTFYTTLGGLKAVVWTDTLQSSIIIGGMLAVIIAGILEVGGLQKMLTINRTGGRLNLINLSVDPTVRMTLWSLLVGRMASFLYSYSVCQTSVQRFSSVPTLRSAKLIMLSNVPFQLILDVLTFACGLVVYSYFSECDPLIDPDLERRLSSPNQLLPLFVMRVMGWPGIPGLFIASLFSATLSTVSSGLGSLATVTWEDLLKEKFNHLSDRMKTTILKILVLIYGICCVGLSFVVNLLPGSILQVSMIFTTSTSSPLFGVFMLGAYFTRSNWLGAVIGGLVGLVLSMWLSVGSYLIPPTPTLQTSIAECVWNDTSSSNFTTTTQMPEPVEGINTLYTISFLYVPVVGIISTVLVGLLASLAADPFIESIQPDDIDDKYIIFPLDRCTCKQKKSTENKAKTDALYEEELKELKL